MTHPLPGPDERALAEALDDAIGKPPAHPVTPASAAALTGLTGLVDDLRRALPLPPFPEGGPAEVRAAASAVRAVRRHNRARLLVAAATMLLVGVVAGGALIGALEQPNLASARVPAQLVLAEKQLGQASLALSAKNPVKAKQLINAAARVIQSQEGQVPTTLPPTVGKSNETATISALTRQLQVLAAENSRLQAALSSKPKIIRVVVPPTTVTAPTTTLPPTTTTLPPTTTTLPPTTTTVPTSPTTAARPTPTTAPPSRALVATTTTRPPPPSTTRPAPTTTPARSHFDEASAYDDRDDRDDKAHDNHDLGAGYDDHGANEQPSAALPPC